MTDWIKHDGKERPVDVDALVMIKVRSGHQSTFGQPAGRFGWVHGPREGSDIVEYRIVEDLSSPETAAHSG